MRIARVPRFHPKRRDGGGGKEPSGRLNGRDSVCRRQRRSPAPQQSGLPHRQEVRVLFRSMKGLKRWFAYAAAACWLGASPLARADDTEDTKALLQRLEKLEKQNDELKK